MSAELEVIKSTRGQIVANVCKDELDAIKNLSGQVLLRMKAIARDEMIDMPQQNLFYFSKTLTEVTKIAKALIDIDKDRPEKEDDALGKLLDRLMGHES